MTTEQRYGLDFPLSFYLQTMTNYSDNNCVNILINHIGLDTINAVCQVAGYASVNMERGLVADDPGGLDNYISAKDVTMMVKDLYTGKFSSIGEDYMRTYFRINEGDSLPTLIGLAPGLADAGAVLNQNGHGMTRYNEIALIEDNGALYILTIMLYGDSGMIYSPAVTDIAEYVSTAMAG
jgi:beta-lactamase class A